MSRFQLFILIEASLIAVAALLGWWFGVDWLSQFESTPANWLIGLVAGLLILPLFFTTLGTSWPPLVEVRETLVNFLGPWLKKWHWGHLLLLSAVAGFAEEALFRGVLQTAWVDQWGVVPGILAASLLFGLCHFVTPLYFILATVIGVYFGLLHHWTGGLVAPAVAHGLYDFLALILLKRHLQKRSQAEPSNDLAPFVRRRPGPPNWG